MTKFNEHDILFEESEVSQFLQIAKSQHQNQEISSQDMIKAKNSFHQLQEKKSHQFNEWQLKPLATAALFVFCFCGGAFAYHYSHKSDTQVKGAFKSLKLLSNINENHVGGINFVKKLSKIEAPINLEIDEKVEEITKSLASQLSKQKKKLFKRDQLDTVLKAKAIHQSITSKTPETFKKKALAIILRSEKASLKDPIHYEAGEMASLMGMPKKSMRAFVRALSTVEGKSSIQHLKRMVKEKSITRKEVIAYILKSKNISTENYALQLLCGWSLLEQNFSLLGHCETFIKQAPQNLNAVTYIVSAAQLIEHQKHDYVKALRFYQYAVLLTDLPSSFSQQALLGRIHCFIKLDDIVSAKKELRKLIAVSQGHSSGEIQKLKDELQVK